MMAKKTTSKSKIENWIFGNVTVSVIRKGKTITIENDGKEIFKSTKESEFDVFWDNFKKVKKYLNITKQ